VPAIDAARKYLGWAPTTDLDSAIRKTIGYYVSQGTGTLPTLAVPTELAS
jgi:nucleoside-diphosphate-sugar epimerase